MCIRDSGKSTFIETLIALLGDYARKTPTATLLQKAFDDNGPSNDLARLAGARMAIAAELPSGRRLDEEKIKDMTGGDTIAARYLHKEFFEFSPIFKLWMYGNHKPTIYNTDEGIWRRINLIPFEVVIPESERDPKLRETLRAELPGILAWAIRGCQEWQAQGLAVPDEVKHATADYRSEMDTLSGFIDEYFVIKAEAITSNKDMHAALTEWAIANGEVDKSGKPTISQKRLASQLIERGFKQDRSNTIGRYWRGLGLLKRPESNEQGGK